MSQNSLYQERRRFIGRAVDNSGPTLTEHHIAIASTYNRIIEGRFNLTIKEDEKKDGEIDKAIAEHIGLGIARITLKEMRTKAIDACILTLDGDVSLDKGLETRFNDVKKKVKDLERIQIEKKLVINGLVKEGFCRDYREALNIVISDEGYKQSKYMLDMHHLQKLKAKRNTKTFRLNRNRRK